MSQADNVFTLKADNAKHPDNVDFLDGIECVSQAAQWLVDNGFIIAQVSIPGRKVIATKMPLIWIEESIYCRRFKGIISEVRSGEISQKKYHVFSAIIFDVTVMWRVPVDMGGMQ